MRRVRLAVELIAVWGAALFLAVLISRFEPLNRFSAVQILSVIGVLGSLAAIVIEVERNRSTTVSADPQATASELPVETDTQSTAALKYDSGENAHLPEFDLIAKIDTGRVVDVSKIQVKETAEIVVLKQPRIKGTISAQIIEEFYSGMRTYETLSDESHIVTLLGWGGVPSPWMLAEYLEGDSLNERMGQIGVEEGLDIMIQICNGLHSAHRKGVVHGDLTPHNVLFPESETISDLKLSDFETASWVAQDRVGGRRVSLRYAAPEQVGRDDDPIDEYTDIYRAGVIAYQLFTGSHPVQGDDSAAVIKNIQAREPTPPSERIPTLPESLDEILLTAIAKEKQDRFDSILHLRDALRELK